MSTGVSSLQTPGRVLSGLPAFMGRHVGRLTWTAIRESSNDTFQARNRHSSHIQTRAHSTRKSAQLCPLFSPFVSHFVPVLSLLFSQHARLHVLNNVRCVSVIVVGIKLVTILCARLSDRRPPRRVGKRGAMTSRSQKWEKERERGRGDGARCLRVCYLDRSNEGRELDRVNLERDTSHAALGKR